MRDVDYGQLFRELRCNSFPNSTIDLADRAEEQWVKLHPLEALEKRIGSPVARLAGKVWIYQFMPNWPMVQQLYHESRGNFSGPTEEKREELVFKTCGIIQPDDFPRCLLATFTADPRPACLMRAVLFPTGRPELPYPWYLGDGSLLLSEEDPQIIETFYGPHLFVYVADAWSMNQPKIKNAKEASHERARKVDYSQAETGKIEIRKRRRK